MARNLETSLRRWADGACTALVLAGGGLAMGLLLLRDRRRRGVGLLGLALVLLAGHLVEAELVTRLLPRLLP